MDHLGLIFSLRVRIEIRPLPCGLPSAYSFNAVCDSCKTCAIPISPNISSGKTSTVKDFDRVRPTVILPRQSSVSSVGEPFWKRP